MFSFALRRRACRLLVPVVVAAVTGVSLATPAAASASLLSCLGTQTIQWNPGLLFTERTVTTSGSVTFGPCLDSANQITSGNSVFGSEETFSCVALLAQSPGTEHVTWNTGETTTFSWTAEEMTNTSVGGQIVATIRTDIESGKFAGMRAEYVITSFTLHTLQCLAEPGLTSASGPVSLTVHA